MRILTPTRRLLGLALIACSALAPGLSEPLAADARPGRWTPARQPMLVRSISYDRSRRAVILGVSGQLAVSTRTVPNPLRLVVDLPGARLAVPKREIIVGDGLVSRIRLAQFSMWPAVVRIVIEPSEGAEPLLAVQQTGRRLMISLGKTAEVPPPSPTPETPGLPESPDLGAPEVPGAGRILPVPPPPAPAGESSVPPVTRPGIRQRLRPDSPARPVTRPSARPDAPPDTENWPTVLPTASARPAPLETDPEPPAAPSRPVETVPDAPEPGVPVLPPGAEAPMDPDGLPTPVPLPRRGPEAPPPGANGR